MKPRFDDNLNRFVFKERLWALDEFERTLVDEGKLPDRDKLLMRRIRFPMQYLGAVILGIFTAVSSLLLNFIVFNMIIHI